MHSERICDFRKKYKFYLFCYDCGCIEKHVTKRCQFQSGLVQVEALLSHLKIEITKRPPANDLSNR